MPTNVCVNAGVGGGILPTLPRSDCEVLVVEKAGQPSFIKVARLFYLC
jgi:hypothetical protein